MPLPDSYMRRAKRGYGMDQSWYEWSMMHERPTAQWPDGARLAVWINVALEFFPLDQPAAPFNQSKPCWNKPMSAMFCLTAGY